MTEHRFTGDLWEHRPGDPGSWHFVTVPAELREELDAGMSCDVVVELACQV